MKREMERGRKSLKATADVKRGDINEKRLATDVTGDNDEREL